jgi:cytochrome c oxidase cbb3-type subunit I/II
MYLIGFCIMIYNIVMTMKSGKLVANEAAVVNEMEKSHSTAGESWHRKLEGRPLTFTIWVTVAILIGGIVEFVPTFLIKSNVPTIAAVLPYTPLELHGRDIYIKEGCVGCHSQMIRPFRSETERYGEYSKAGEFVYDHPFLWGSKRTGPDLHRIGAKYPDAWHYNHMVAPTSMSPGSIMPAYPWLAEQNIDLRLTPKMINAMRSLGVPYAAGYQDQANADLKKQADKIVSSLKKDGIKAVPESEMVALIAYLQRMGTDIKKSK